MAAFEHTKVDPGRLLISSKNIEESLMLAEKALTNIENCLLNTLKSSWSGEASTEFFARYTTDKQNFVILFNKLKSLNAQLMQASGVYEKADTEANDLVNSLSIG